MAVVFFYLVKDDIMKKPFESFYYEIEVVTPVHIGGSKDNDLMLGADFYCQNDDQLVFFNQNQVLKRLSPQLLKEYSTLISKNEMLRAAEIVKNLCLQCPELKGKSVDFPFEKPNEIKRHYANGLGKITIPGSSIKGALRSCFGNHMISNGAPRPSNNRSFDDLFGSINNNLMRLIQVTDVELDTSSSVLPMKIYSGDISNYIQNNQGVLIYEGEGTWKDLLNGGHSASFKEDGFVFNYETCTRGAKGKLRINWANGLDDLIAVDKKPTSYKLFDEIKSNKWMHIVRIQMASFIEKERRFYDKFYNVDFDIVFKLLDELEKINNDENSVLLRLGAGSGYHAITGNWNYNDHTQTKQAQIRNRNTQQFENINAIKYKTRKVAFGVTQGDEGEQYDFQLPGFVKITIQD